MNEDSTSLIDVRSNATTPPFLPYLFSAASEKSLRALVESYSSYLKSPAGASVDLRRLGYTLACRRSVLPYKISYTAATQEELSNAIDASLSGDPGLFNTRSSVKDSSVLGVFTGQGAQWPRMGAELIQSSYARQIIAELDESLASLPESDRPRWTICEEIFAEAAASRLGQAAVAQPITCAVQILLLSLLERAGVRLQSVVGHSSGEIAAAYAAGFISRTDAIRIAYYRGFTSNLAAGPSGQAGGMLAVGTSYEDAQELCGLDGFQGRIAVAASNSPTSVTISGDIDAIEELKVILEEEGKFVRALRVDKAYHSHHMKPAAQSFLNSLQACNITVLTPPDNAPTWYSSVYQDRVIDTKIALDGQYWIDNLSRPVLFSQVLETAFRRTSHPFYAAIEVGPHPALRGPVLDMVKQVTDSSLEYTGCLSRGKNDVKSFSSALGTIWAAAGASAVDFSSFQAAVFEDPGVITALNDLPRYPWNHDRILWTESRATKLMRQQDDNWHDLLGTRESDGTEEEWRWRNVLMPKELPWLTDHALQGQTVFPATGYFCLALEAAMQVAGRRPVKLLELTDFKIRKAIAIDERDGTETLVSLTKINQSEHEITASFACFSTISRDALQLALNTTGDIRVTLGTPVLDALAPRAPLMNGMQPVDSDHFYEEVAKIGYNYGPTFRGIQTLERKLGYSRGSLAGPPNNETGTVLLFHPGMLDAALQGMLCGFSSPGDGRLWSLHAPSTIRRVTLVPSLCGMNMTREVFFDCAVTDVEFNRLTGDVEVYQSDTGYKSISLEGTSFVPFTAATEAHDRNLFAQEVWKPDAPDGALALGSYRASPEDVQKGLDAERAAFYYLKVLHDTITPEVRASFQLPPHHEALLDYAELVYNMVQRDEHAYIKREWTDDTYEQVSAIMER